MSVTSTVDKTGPFLITGLPQVIPVGFSFQSSVDLLVLDTGSSNSRDPATVLVLGSDYTVTGGGYNSANQMQTGSITLVSTGSDAVLVGDNIVIMRGEAINQPSSFVSTGPLTLELLEQALDRQATLSQQVNEVTTRSLQFENFEFTSGVMNKALRAGKYIGFDANGNLIFPTAVAQGDIISATNSIYNVIAFGADKSGGTDSHVAIQNAINACQGAGGGIVFFPAGSYLVTATLTVGGSGVEIRGAGMGNTIIGAPHSAAFTILNIAGAGATPGVISTYQQENMVRDITIGQALAPAGPTTSNPGINIQYNIFPKLVDVQIANCGTGLYLLGTVDFQGERIRITSSSASVATSYGVFIDGTQQNASTYFSHCLVGFGSFSGTTSYGFFAHGANLSDLFLDNCEGDGCSIGFGLDGGATSGAFACIDIHLNGFIADQVGQGISIINVPDNLGAVNINGGYVAINKSGSSCVGIASSSGVTVSGMQLFVSGGGTSFTGNSGVFLQNSRNCSIVRNTIKGAFAQHIELSGSSDWLISGNIIEAISTASSDDGIGVTSSPNGSIVGNIFSGISGAKLAFGVVCADLVSGNVTVTGNVFDTAGIVTNQQILFAGGTDSTWVIPAQTGYVAAVGQVGSQIVLDINFVTPVSGGISQTSSVVTNLGSIALTAGTWQLTGLFGFSWPVGVTVTGVQYGIMTANNVMNGTIPGGINRDTLTYVSSQTFGTVYERAMTTLFITVASNTTTTFFANALTFFSGSPDTSNAVCLVTATRIL